MRPSVRHRLVSSLKRQLLREIAQSPELRSHQVEIIKAVYKELMATSPSRDDRRLKELEVKLPAELKDKIGRLTRELNTSIDEAVKEFVATLPETERPEAGSRHRGEIVSSLAIELTHAWMKLNPILLGAVAGAAILTASGVICLRRRKNKRS